MADVVLFLGLIAVLAGLLGLVFARGRRFGALKIAGMGVLLVVGASPFIEPMDPDERARRDAARAEAARQEQEEAARAEAQRAEEEAADRAAGFHCLSQWDGRHRAFARTVQNAMRDPDSFEHIETRITPVNDDGEHVLEMQYRARNGFGGMNVGRAMALIDNATCAATALQIE